MSHADDDRWSIKIRPVGGESKSSTADFLVQVNPEDQIQALHEKIQGVTGLSRQQQRLIYRGRLISGKSHQEEESKESVKIRDITGLRDGHTIHLVKRKGNPEDAESSDGTNTASTARSFTANTNASSSSDTSSSASLLSTLLGFGSNNNSNNNTNEGAEGVPASSDASVRRWRRFGRRGRAHYRLTAEDIEVPDPGSMESVRQGLMTLHTLLPATTNVRRNPLEVNRQWYRGQWIDVRDTVNQWLEATIVEIVKPDELLPPRPCRARDGANNNVMNNNNHNNSPGMIQPVNDPPVHGDDLNGRYRLLLEVCPDGCQDEDEGGEWEGFRRRSSNDNAVLLLVHYNGWPHRWDEWIRSDSERLRPFRVRTRHPNGNSVAPTVQAPYADSPSTFIRGATEAEDRQHVLPELLRVTAAVESLMQQAVGPELAATMTETSQPALQGANLPWRRHMEDPPEDAAAEDDETVESSVALASYADASSVPDEPPRPRRSPREQAQALQALAPLLDRLGRTLVDAAPHVAALAAAQVEEAAHGSQNQLDTIDEHPNSLGGLLSMLSRDRRRNSIASSQAVASLSTTTEPTNQTVTSHQGDQGTVASNADANTIYSEEISIDPDYTDFAVGLVNTTRGEVRTGPRARAASSSDDLSSLLGAYLAAASMASGDSGDESNSNLQLLGRILRDRDGSGGGGGIDIHIHAVVTAPGMTADGDNGGGGGPAGGLRTLLTGMDSPTTGSNGTTRPTATLADDLDFLPTARRVPSVLQQQDDDLGIFSELYSENPEQPLTPRASAVVAGPSSARHSGTESAPTSSQSASAPSSRQRSHRHSNLSQNSGHNSHPNNSNNQQTSTSNSSSPTHRRQGFLGRFLRRNQSSE